MASITPKADGRQCVVRVVLADRQRAFATALAVRLRDETDLEVVAVATTPAALDEVLRTTETDVLVTDISLNGAGVDDDLAGRWRRHPSVQVVVLSAAEDTAVVVEALRAGVSGYLTKATSVDELLAAIRGSLRGETSVSPRLLTGVINQLLKPQQPTASERRVQALTAREREILEALVAGMAPAAIARELVVSTSTVRTHAQRVREKLGVHSTLEAVSIARRAGVRPRRQA